MVEPIRHPADHSQGARIERLEPRGGAGGQARGMSRIVSSVAAVPDDGEFDDTEGLLAEDAQALQIALERVEELRAVSAELRSQIDNLEFTVREHVEIEHARDLEIGRLENELEDEKKRSADLATGLFHSRRRAEDLDRRWNDLAATYEECAERLVEAGAQLEAIHAQSGYRIVMATVRMAKRLPTFYRATRRLGRIFSKRADEERLNAK